MRELEEGLIFHLYSPSKYKVLWKASQSTFVVVTEAWYKVRWILLSLALVQFSLPPLLDVYLRYTSVPDAEITTMLLCMPPVGSSAGFLNPCSCLPLSYLMRQMSDGGDDWPLCLIV